MDNNDTNNHITDAPLPAVTPRTRPRQGSGRYAVDPATAERDAAATEMRKRGIGYRQIGEYFGVSHVSALHMVRRCLKAARREAGEDLLELELQKLDMLEARLAHIMRRNHLVVSQGHVVYDGAEPIRDDAPEMAAIDNLRRLYESRRKLLGLDAAKKIDVNGGVKYEIVGVDIPTELT